MSRRAKVKPEDHQIEKLFKMVYQWGQFGVKINHKSGTFRREFKKAAEAIDETKHIED